MGSAFLQVRGIRTKELQGSMRQRSEGLVSFRPEESQLRSHCFFPESVVFLCSQVPGLNDQMLEKCEEISVFTGKAT